jgi:hypothetical protein
MVRNAAEITREEYDKLKRKENKSKEEYSKMRKHRLQKQYKVLNMPRWFIKVTKNKNIQYENIKAFKEINGVIDQNRRMEMMKMVRDRMMERIYFADDIYGEIPRMEMEMNIMMCMHGLNILKIVGGEEHIRNNNRFKTKKMDEVETLLNKYMCGYSDQIKEGLKYTDDIFTKNISTDKGIIKMSSNILNKEYAIKLKIDEEGYVEVINTWTTSDGIWICPYNTRNDDTETLIFRDEIIQADNRLIIGRQWIRDKISALIL